MSDKLRRLVETSKDQKGAKKKNENSRHMPYPD